MRARFVRWATSRPRPLLVAQLVGLGLGLALGWVGGILVEAGGTLDAAKACTSSRHLAAESHELYELLADPAGVELEAASFSLLPPRAECAWSVAEGTGLITEHSFDSFRVVGAIAGAGYLALVLAAATYWRRHDTAPSAARG